MGAANVTMLRERLEDLLKQLQRFDSELKNDFGVLDTAWSQLESVWDGYAYQEFVGSWQGVRHMMRQYLNLSNNYEQFLKERIGALSEFERNGGV